MATSSNNLTPIVKWFDDVFDILDDSSDELEHRIEEYNQDFDFDYLHTNVDEEEMINEDNSINTIHHDNQIVQQQVLSQKLSQLSTKEDDDREAYSVNEKKRSWSSPSTPDVSVKKNRLFVGDENDNDDVPDYLQTTNPIFERTMINHVTTNMTTLTMADLRQLAILKHKIAAMTIRKELWSVYLKSGTGQWETEESRKATMIDRRFWPMQVQIWMSSSKSNALDLEVTNDEQKMYESRVNEHLAQLNVTIEQYQLEFNAKQNCFIGFTDEINREIDDFVQHQGIRPLQMKFNHEITLLKYDYDAQLLERKYRQFKPTDDQIEIARCLYNLKYEAVQAKQELIELKERILCNKPTKSMTSVLLPKFKSTTTETMMNERVHQRLLDGHEKEKQEKRTEAMLVNIGEAENNIHQCEQSFNEGILQVSVNDSRSKNGLPGHLVDLIYRRFNIIKQKLEHIGHFRVSYLLRSHYGGDEEEEEEKFNMANVSFSPTIIIDTSSRSFTEEQLRLLNRGPTYVPPCQMYVPSTPNVSMNDRMESQFKLLQYHLSIVFAKFNVNAAESMFITKQIKDIFKDVFSISLPSAIHQRALYEHHLVQSIRQQLKANNLILRRTADQRNVFYLGNRIDFKDKATEYMIKTDMFEVNEVIDDTNLRQTRAFLNKKTTTFIQEVEKLFPDKKEKHKEILKKLSIQIDKVQLPYLYFLPDMSKKNDMSLKPVVVSQHSATSRLAQFLDELLRPAIQRHADCTTFINGTDFIRKLNRYADDEHRLRPTTIFTTIKICNFYTMVPHGILLITLQDFLSENYIIFPTEHISPAKVIRLTALFLHNNRFYYDNKIYRFTKGSPGSFSLTETLCQIYAYQWQKSLRKERALQDELFGSCKNQIFFTWNEKSSELDRLLKAIQNEDTNVELDIKIGLHVSFLSAYVENHNGTLYSRVDHDLNSQKYTLPYTMGHPKLANSHWLRSGLVRAARFCTSVYDFDLERIHLEIACLANGYSLEFVEHRVNHFFIHFDAKSLRSSLDQHVYEKLRHRLFNFIHEQRHYSQSNAELEKKNLFIRLSYSYQFGPKHEFHKKVREILSAKLNVSDIQSLKNKMKVIFTPQEQYSLNALLSEQKPFHPLLNNEKTLF